MSDDDYFSNALEMGYTRDAAREALARSLSKLLLSKLWSSSSNSFAEFIQPLSKLLGGS